MPSEREWVASWVERLQSSLNRRMGNGSSMGVADQHRLAYTHEIQRYRDKDPLENTSSGYATDLLVFDRHDEREWTPRVVIETKLGSVTTHDALTYSAKASTHKHVHPYLRYGILIGNYGHDNFPARLFRHGAYFDFMMTWKQLEPATAEWKEFLELLVEEIEASRQIQSLMNGNRQRGKPSLHLIHRPLRLK
jgi:hypothetical protein